MTILIIEGSGKSGFESEPDNSPFIQLGIELAKNGKDSKTFRELNEALSSLQNE